MTNLLDGVRVVELAPLLSGALAGMTLADLGADVIKVEPPGGDLLRHVFGALAPGFSPPFVQLNRGKRSVTADMDAEDDRTFVAELARDADVLVLGYPPSAVARWGLDEGYLNAPHLIYCRITGFGADTVYRDQPAHGLTMAAVAGATCGGADAGGVSGDGTAAVAVAHAAVEHVTAALVRRASTGQGCSLDVSGAEAMLAADVMRVTYETNAGREGVDAAAAEAVLSRAQVRRPSHQGRRCCRLRRCGTPSMAAVLHRHWRDGPRRPTGTVRFEDARRMARAGQNAPSGPSTRLPRCGGGAYRSGSD
ncbi:L-carnitine dehydratase/bile acid-inducible protein F OS=Tsukamurella paurometabola (strain ATCC 8368/ DSM / CCUG 35730 / CIP 100753 / JCM 10117 / KCTC 9821 / NBRC 16120 / NCIMB 702349 / NCTC 13040) OX=521096 GN=Tpau_2228 PE=4 SV=1 [Tsukamurella paurometabola]